MLTIRNPALYGSSGIDLARKRGDSKDSGTGSPRTILRLFSSTTREPTPQACIIVGAYSTDRSENE